MLFAAFGDISGHAGPLRRALFHAEEAGIMTFLQAGNVAVGGPEPEKVLQILAQSPVIGVRGDTDWTLARFEKKRSTFEKRLDPSEFAAYELAANSLTSSSVEWLDKLPRTRQLSLENISVILCHGTPMSEREVLEADTPLSRLQRCREARPAQIIVCGGAARPYSRWVDDTLFVNCGRLTEDGETATYVTISTDDSPWAVRIVEVPGDQVA